MPSLACFCIKCGSADACVTVQKTEQGMPSATELLILFSQVFFNLRNLSPPFEA